MAVDQILIFGPGLGSDLDREGHGQSIAVVLQKYVHPTAEHKRAAMLKYAAIMGPVPLAPVSVRSINN